MAGGRGPGGRGHNKLAGDRNGHLVVAGRSAAAETALPRRSAAVALAVAAAAAAAEACASDDPSDLSATVAASAGA